VRESVADVAERIGRCVEAGVECLDNFLHFGDHDDPAIGQLLRCLREGADRDDALVPIVKLVRVVAV